VLNEVGSAYRILGRPYQAIDLINRSFEIYLSKYNYRINAARSARNLSKTYMQIGRLEEAIKLAEKAINLTDKSTELLMDRYISHANLGRALHLFGKLDDARRNFEESQKLKAEIGRSHSEQSLWGDRFTLQETHYCDLLAEENNTEIALALLDSIPQTTKDVLGVLDYALYHYSRGKVSLIQSQKQGAQNYRVAREHLDEAIENLKRAMRQDELGFAYLARSLLHRLRGNLSMARSDLNAAQEIAERGSIKILLADCYLEACHLQLARFEPGGATRDLDKAKTLVEEMGYDRRKKEIMELDEAINPK
jgi:tetratricopeptide (TPR) repeat protein